MEQNLFTINHPTRTILLRACQAQNKLGEFISTVLGRKVTKEESLEALDDVIERLNAIKRAIEGEGKDDMAAHIRTVLTQSTLSIPVHKGKCDLGIWQGIFLWEHRTQSHKRNLSVTVMGE